MCDTLGNSEELASGVHVPLSGKKTSMGTDQLFPDRHQGFNFEPFECGDNTCF